MNRTVFLLLLVLLPICGKADNGSGLWLPKLQAKVKVQVSGKVRSSVGESARRELQTYWKSGRRVHFVYDSTLPKEGFRITLKTRKSNQYEAEIAAADDSGLLYGAFSLLRWQDTGSIGLDSSNNSLVRSGRESSSAPATVQSWSDAPLVSLRLMNHWDNIDGSIERGYAGRSIFWHSSLPRDKWREHIRQYARACASIGINGAVLNNVNASPKILSPEYLDTLKIIADILRPYGMRTYLSVNFGSPKALGSLDTADPLDSRVKVWWKDKARYIYNKVPDFGGFLVKANSEGQPGPFDYGRTHADGANMLAEAVAPYGGIVMWRSFVYGSKHKGEDRVKQAVSEFADLDGKFADNVILQSKNGPLDFQPREPYAPIFDCMHKTRQMAELQVTQEYTGQSKHLVYLAPMWKEFFSFVRPDSILPAAVSPNGESAQLLKGIAGVSNVGDEDNWCGHDFSQANWYAFGRLAWNYRLSSTQIAREWVVQTFGSNSVVVDSLVSMMETSRETCVDYMMPLGLHHIFKFDHHYGPEPGGFKADYPLEWCPVYYHKADSLGVGFDRTVATGSGATSQYRAPYDSIYERLETCPDKYLLWFHHVPWNYKMSNGNTLWQNMQQHYRQGVDKVQKYMSVWQSLHPYIDEERWQRVSARLKEQIRSAEEWRDTCLEYFGRFAEASQGREEHK
ncbi:MAG: alpha-glucuronidase [Prevotella sp.]|jgi:alpha-glucuronidase